MGEGGWQWQDIFVNEGGEPRRWQGLDPNLVILVGLAWGGEVG